jgi:hypothetical protein
MTLTDLKAYLQKESGRAEPVISVDNDSVTASKECSELGSVYSVTVPLRDYTLWRSGELAQNAFPYLSADQREFLISGSTPAEFEAMFGDEEEEE